MTGLRDILIAGVITAIAIHVLCLALSACGVEYNGIIILGSGYE